MSLKVFHPSRSDPGTLLVHLGTSGVGVGGDTASREDAVGGLACSPNPSHAHRLDRAQTDWSEHRQTGASTDTLDTAQKLDRGQTDWIERKQTGASTDRLERAQPAWIEDRQSGPSKDRLGREQILDRAQPDWIEHSETGSGAVRPNRPSRCHGAPSRRRAARVATAGDGPDRSDSGRRCIHQHIAPWQRPAATGHASITELRKPREGWTLPQQSLSGVSCQIPPRVPCQTPLRVPCQILPRSRPEYPARSRPDLSVESAQQLSGPGTPPAKDWRNRARRDDHDPGLRRRGARLCCAGPAREQMSGTSQALGNTEPRGGVTGQPFPPQS